VHQLEALACKVSMVRVVPDRPAAAALQERAATVARQVTGLMEKLSVIEVDDQRGEALLRSDSPVARENDRLYYEVVLERMGTATLHRYQGSTVKSQRKEVSFSLTHEAVAKLVTDLAR
jgi:hypothetical protein